MENNETIDKIMATVKENLELSADICREYGYVQTEKYLRNALHALADAKVTKELEESQKLELKDIIEEAKNAIPDLGEGANV